MAAPKKRASAKAARAQDPARYKGPAVGGRAVAAAAEQESGAGEGIPEP